MYYYYDESSISTCPRSVYIPSPIFSIFILFIESNIQFIPPCFPSQINFVWRSIHVTAHFYIHFMSLMCFRIDRIMLFFYIIEYYTKLNSQHLTPSQHQQNTKKLHSNLKRKEKMLQKYALKIVKKLQFGEILLVN